MTTRDLARLALAATLALSFGSALGGCGSGGGAASGAHDARGGSDGQHPADAGGDGRIGTDDARARDTGPRTDGGGFDALDPGDGGGPPTDALGPGDRPDFADVIRPAPWSDAGPRPALCDAPAPLPVAARIRVEAPELGDYGFADAAYDAAGRLAVVTRGGDLYRVAPDGRRTLWAANVVKTPRGMVFLSTGELVVADSGRGLLVQIYPDGQVRTLVPHLDAPMGLEVDARDFLYVSEATRGAIRQVDPLTGRLRVVADALDLAPGALAFSPDYRTLYVIGTGTATIHALDRDENGDFGPLRTFAHLGGSANVCDGHNAGDPCGNRGTCRLDGTGVLVCLPDGQCLPEDLGLPCGEGGICLSDGAGGALCSGDTACEDHRAGDICVSLGVPGLCAENGAGGLACRPPPCSGAVAGGACLDVEGRAGLCADNLGGRLSCQVADVCNGRIEGAPCMDPTLDVPGLCARAGRAGLYCAPENLCVGQTPGARCLLPGLGRPAFCALDATTGLPWCRPPANDPCAGGVDGQPCATAAGTQGVCFNTEAEWLCVDPNPCVSPGRSCVNAEGVAGICLDDGGGTLICRAVACQGQPEGVPCTDLDGTEGHCLAGLCTPDSACDGQPAGSPCHSPRTRGPGLCGPGAGGVRLCQPVNPCAGLAGGAECTLRPGSAGTCVVSAEGGEPFCEPARGGGVPRALETDACGNVYVSDDAVEGIWRISADGEAVTLAASLLQAPVTTLALGGGPPRRAVVPLTDTVEPRTPPDAPALDCLNLADAPVSLRPVLRARGYHDVALDQSGHVIGFDGSALVQVDQQGNTRPYAAGIQGAEGMDWLPDGSLVVASPLGLVRISPNGGQVVIAPDVFAYGVTVGPDGMVYAADNSTQIWRIDASTLAREVYWSNVGSTSFAPRTIAFDLDRSLMYIGSFGDKVYSMAIGPDLTPLAPPRMLAVVNPGAAFLDGLTVDACGNLYMPNYESAALYRIAPDGEVRLFHQWELSQYGHGLEWGSGVGGFRADALYLPQPYNLNSVLEVVVGIPGNPSL